MTGSVWVGLPTLEIERVWPIMTEYVCRCGETWSLSMEPPPACLPAACCKSSLVPFGEPHQEAIAHEVGSRGLCVLCGGPPTAAG